MRRALLAGPVLTGVALVALCAPASSLAARWAVGVPSGQFQAVAAQLPGARTLVPGRTLVVTSPHRPQVLGARYVMPLDGVKRQVASVRKAAFENTEPLAASQWYLDQDHAWDFWREEPDLPDVTVAVIDSGIDYGHPDFAGRVLGGKSFIGGSWKQDTEGHGTFVAGVIAANAFNGVGIAGLGFNVQLLIGKVVEPDGVSPGAEAEAITWAADRGAQVINLSIGGVRDPQDASLDTFSPPERDAIAYAVSKGVVVVSAVGNGDIQKPWNFADWPSALPHVIGVGALRADGSVPAFSNRDPLFVDMAAPGEGVFSTIPRNLIDRTRVGCSQPYSDCGPPDFVDAIGTSFSAPQVSAAAALLLGVDPTLKPDQVGWLLERSATDITTTTCTRCRDGRDSLTGWGRLNVLAALETLRHSSSLPRADAYEPNDDAGSEAYGLGTPRSRALTATVDYWDDGTDVYSVKLAAGDILSARLSSSIPLGRMQLWAPGTTHVGDLRATLSNGAARSAAVSARERLDFRAQKAGTYFLAVRVGRPTRERPVYKLTVATRSAA